MKTLQQLTITKLKLICKENNLIYKKKFKKVDYINLINYYFKTNNIKLNEQSTETEISNEPKTFIGIDNKEFLTKSEERRYIQIKKANTLTIEQKIEINGLIPLYHQKLGFIGVFTKEKHKAKQQEMGGVFSTDPFPDDYAKELSYI